MQLAGVSDALTCVCTCERARSGVSTAHAKSVFHPVGSSVGVMVGGGRGVGEAGATGETVVLAASVPL
jgi:hypothetical protein